MYSPSFSRRETLYDPRYRDQHIHVGRQLLSESIYGRNRQNQRRQGVLHDTRKAGRIVSGVGEAQFAYPPTPETIRATFRAVKYCTRRGIAINTFMLDTSYYLKAFMDEIARLNGGRVFYTSPEKLGEYILVDYVQNKRNFFCGLKRTTQSHRP